MNLDQVRALGEVYRLVINQSPDIFERGHEFKAAQRPFIFLNRAVEKVSNAGALDQFVQDVVATLVSSLPTDAVSDTLFEEQQAAFLMGYNTKRFPTRHVKGLRAVRMSRGISQEELASISGIARSQISSYETGREYNIGTLRRLKAALHCSADDLV